MFIYTVHFKGATSYSVHVTYRLCTPYVTDGCLVRDGGMGGEMYWPVC